MGVWVFFDFCVLGAGVFSLAFSILSRRPDLLMNMVFSNADLTAAMCLGIMFIGTFALSLCAIAQKNRVTIGLAILNWTLIVDAFVVVIIGSFIWFFTLRERDHFHAVYAAQSIANRIAIQDKLQCCGYFNASDLIEFGGNFCTDPNFVASPAFLGPNGTTPNFCVDPITAFVDSWLNIAFTTVYGYMAIIMSFILATLCVISKRIEDERFRKIDLKRGGGGFA